MYVKHDRHCHGQNEKKKDRRLNENTNQNDNHQIGMHFI